MESVPNELNGHQSEGNPSQSRSDDTSSEQACKRPRTARVASPDRNFRRLEGQVHQRIIEASRLLHNQYDWSVSEDLGATNTVWAEIERPRRNVEEQTQPAESDGCFQIPSVPILAEFLRAYFYHVHPLLPLVHEGDFMASTSSEEQGDNSNTTRGRQHASLLLLQAILLSSAPVRLRRRSHPKGSFSF